MAYGVAPNAQQIKAWRKHQRAKEELRIKTEELAHPDWNADQKLINEAKGHHPSLIGNAKAMFGFGNKDSTEYANRVAAARSREFNRTQNNKRYSQLEDFSKHSIQYRMEDYKRSGINPILASKGIGATLPLLQSASTGMETTMKNPIWDMASSVLGTATGLKMAKNIGANRELSAMQHADKQRNAQGHLEVARERLKHLQNQT